MRILFHFRTQGTGAEGVHIAGMAGAFRRLGHDVVFLSPNAVDPAATAGDNPFRRQRQGLLSRLAARAPRLVFELLEIGYNAVAAWRLARLLGGKTFDLVYERHAFFLCLTAVLAAHHRVPFIVEVNELPGDERIRAQPWLLPVARWADRVTFRRAGLIAVVSPHLARRVEAMGVRPEKILVLPNAVDEQTLDSAADGLPIRQQFACSTAIVIGFAGWFVAWHKLEVLVTEFAALASGGPDLRLMLVGDGPLRAELVTQASELGVGHRLIFTGAVSHATMPQYLAAMDICVVPHSNAYRSPIKLFEYMARGRAIVAPRTEPIALVLRHGDNALLFEPENAVDMRAQIAALAADPALRARLGAQARRNVRDRHTWTGNARTLLDRLP